MDLIPVNSDGRPQAQARIKNHFEQTNHLVKHGPDCGTRLVDGRDNGVAAPLRHVLHVAHDTVQGG
jgi:hypothetical protein